MTPLSIWEQIQLSLATPTGIFFAIFFGVLVTGIYIFLWDARRQGWQYIPADWPKISPYGWKKIEGAMGVELAETRSKFYRLGKKAMLNKITSEIESKQTVKTAYEILDLEIGSEYKLEERVTHLLSLYNPENFEYLDEAFVKLATIRTEEVNKAAGRIRSIRAAAAKRTSVSGGNF
jgi:hypothetical protein